MKINLHLGDKCYLLVAMLDTLFCGNPVKLVSEQSHNQLIAAANKYLHCIPVIEMATNNSFLHNICSAILNGTLSDAPSEI